MTKAEQLIEKIKESSCGIDRQDVLIDTKIAINIIRSTLPGILADFADWCWNTQLNDIEVEGGAEGWATAYLEQQK